MKTEAGREGIACGHPSLSVHWVLCTHCVCVWVGGVMRGGGGWYGDVFGV